MITYKRLTDNPSFSKSEFYRKISDRNIDRPKNIKLRMAIASSEKMRPKKPVSLPTVSIQDVE